MRKQNKDFNYYCDFIMETFNFFNGSVNPTKLSSEVMVGVNNPNLGGFNDGNKVIIFLDNIIKTNKLFKNIEDAIMYFMVHELTHIEHGVDLEKYENDVKYNYKTEYYTDYHTFMYIFSNSAKIKNKFEMFTIRSFIKPFSELISKGITNNYNEKIHSGLFEKLIPKDMKLMMAITLDEEF